QLVKDLEKLAPFGPQNEKPLFFSEVKLQSFDILSEKHVRWNFSPLNKSRPILKGISFNYIGSWGKTNPSEFYTAQNRGETLKITYYLEVNRWKGNEYIQLMIQNIHS
ncbi:MAG: hypothetical protein WCG27_11880, partial [Pseudomonadota bacterium]